MRITSLINALPGATCQGLIWGIMAIGVYITYKILDLADLTVDGTMCTGAAVCVMLTLNGVPLPIAMICAFGAGMLAGWVTGMLHTKMGIPAILAGILTQMSLYSINMRIMGGRSNVAISVDKYPLLVSLRHVNKVPFLQNSNLVALIFVVVCILVLYWFFGTEMGCSIRSTGSNENMSRAQGINTDRTKIIGLMLSNGIVALASALIGQYAGNSDVNMGRGAIVYGLAAVIIGEVVFSKISVNFAMQLVAVVLGAVIFFYVIQIVLWLGLNTNDLKMISAIIVALFLGIPYLKKKHFSKGGALRA